MKTTFFVFPCFAVKLPRRFPSGPTLLTRPDYLSGINLNDKTDWTLAEWQAFARYLEESGQSLAAELDRKETEIDQISQKLRRRKKPAPSRKGTLLTGFEQQPANRPGRKADPHSLNNDLAKAVLAKSERLKAIGEKKNGL